MRMVERAGTLLGFLCLLTGCPTSSPVSNSPDDLEDSGLGADVREADGADLEDASEAPDGDDVSEPRALALTGLHPAVGSVDGGTRLVLNGEGFSDGLRVYFGGQEATHVEVTSTIRAGVTTPAAEGPGAVDVTVRRADGEEASLVDGFRYEEEVAPHIGYCQLQRQSPVEADAGMPTPELYAVVFAEGITEGEGRGEGIVAELGWGPVGASPESFTFEAMTYNTDKDGLVPGEMANDEYGASITIDEAGSYRYIARFRLDEASAEWLYCDLEGVFDGATLDHLGVLEVNAPDEPSIEYCLTETSSVTVEVGQVAGPISGLVYVPSVTDGDGQGSGVTAEILWGPADEPVAQWTETVVASFKEDSDGLQGGDKANDRYEASWEPAQAGDYGFVYRFSLDGGQTWSLCDTSGSDGTPGGFDDSEVGELSVVEAVIDLPDQCWLQHPHLVAGAAPGETVTVYGRVFKAGMTDTMDGHPSVVAEALVGPEGADPVADPAAFTNVAAAHNPAVANEDQDEYAADIVLNGAGRYSLAYRFSVDGGQHWLHCDTDGASTGFDPDRAAVVVVDDLAPELIDHCHVWQQDLTGTVGADGPLVTVEVYEAGVTENNGGANAGQLEVEVGYGAPGTHPALAGVYTWRATPLGYKGLRPGHPNNYEYEGIVYESAQAPAVGAYDVVVRVRAQGQTAWTYCDANEHTMEFRLDAISQMSIQ